MEVIAERKLFALFPNGKTANVYLCVGRPAAHPNGDWVCPVHAEGLRLWQGPTNLFGVGSWHALMIGLRFLHKILSAEVQQGAVFHYEGGKQPIEVDELFMLHYIE